MKTSLVIMAAGIGSRYGKGIKQLETIGPNGEILMDYSIMDAKKAGFDQVVFIIRHDIEQEFRKVIGNRIEKIIPCQYVYQELNDIPKPFEVGNRTKPWGTGQAILAASSVIDGPFAVINADDYYGSESFQLIHDYLTKNHEDNQYCMVGYLITNTLSENGGVNRGVCKLNENGELLAIKESYQVKEVDGKIISENNPDIHHTDLASMNFFGFQPTILEELKVRFNEFLKKLAPDDIKTEFLIPEVVSDLIQEGTVKVKVLKTDSRWFGITYLEDTEKVKKELQKIYSKKL